MSERKRSFRTGVTASFQYSRRKELARSPLPGPGGGARAGYPGRAGGPWLRKILVPSGLRAVVVPSGCSVTVQPHW
jgi:hypothetical protein